MSPAAAADAPSAEALAWVGRSCGGDEVVGRRRLTGGVATATHLLQLRSGRHVVLRRHLLRWLEPGDVAGEMATLAHVWRCGLPVPELLAADPDGAETGGRPALLMSRLPGRIDLVRADPGSWLRQVADALADIHAHPAVPVPAEERAADDEVPRVRDEQPPAWSAHPALWARAIELLLTTAPVPRSAPPPTLVHGDYQHFNLLWLRGRLTGVVDWGRPGLEPLDRDLGHCRLNLVILYGTEAADAFLRRYVEVTGGRQVDPWWDLFETVVFLPSWASTIVRQVGRRIPFDVDAMHRRVDEHLPTVLARLDR